jgi:hypothetical protein
MIRLHEYMNFDQLFRLSEPKRVVRSRTVKGPPLKIDAYSDSTYWAFNFKSNPSTEHRRHQGYIKFIKPPSQRRLELVNCVVDCTCKDFRYRWAWTNKQRQASRVGPGTMNQAWNRAPRITNPEGKPGLCKHILALSDFIYGAMSSFPASDREGDESKLMNKLVKYADKKWTSTPEEDELRKQRDLEMSRRRLARNRGQAPDNAPLEMTIADEDEPGADIAAAPVVQTGGAADVAPPNDQEDEETGQVPLIPPRPPREESVVISMNAKESLSIIEEMAETEQASEALSCLREIRDLLSKMVEPEPAAPAPENQAPAPEEDVAAPAAAAPRIKPGVPNASQE